MWLILLTMACKGGPDADADADVDADADSDTDTDTLVRIGQPLEHDFGQNPEPATNLDLSGVGSHVRSSYSPPARRAEATESVPFVPDEPEGLTALGLHLDEEDGLLWACFSTSRAQAPSPPSSGSTPPAPSPTRSTGSPSKTRRWSSSRSPGAMTSHGHRVRPPRPAVRVAFDTEIATPAEVRSALVALVKQARIRSGI